MFNAKSGVFAVSLLSLALAGCTSDRFAPAASAPPPLTPAPTGTISGSQLPPPSSPTGPSAFPQAPGQQTQDMAALDPNASAGAGAAVSGPAISAGSVAGVWNVNVGGQSCRVATPQTKFGQGYRAGPLRCPAPFDGVKSWNVEGGSLAFYDENGQALARLSSAGGQNFNGQTTSGQPISLSR
jgi:hypothetical protein